jgi:membrane fusion protein, copper/silver efflux system
VHIALFKKVKHMKTNISIKKIGLIVGILLIGIVLGKFIFQSSGSGSPTEENINTEQADNTIWTCSMHPQIRMPEPGNCPICGMELIPADNGGNENEMNPDELQMTEAAVRLADIETSIVKKQSPVKKVYLLGKVKPDERQIYSQTSHIPGRIEKLYINFTGEKVSKGQRLASIYSPELITAQKELFEVMKDTLTGRFLLEAARNKLRYWKFTDEQINKLEKSGELQTEVDILSDYNGYVFKRHVSLGDHVMEGMPLFQIVDLSNVWVMFEAYETDLPWMKLGDEVSITLQSVPGKTYKGKISYIDPFINPNTRIANVRVSLTNRNFILKPDMFANGIIDARLPVNNDVLLIPKSAALWTGKRAVVYIKVPGREDPTFVYREIVLGAEMGDFYVVESGLEEGEEIATNGVFRIDAAAQLAGKPSMMNPEGGKVSLGGHAGMDMGGDKGGNNGDMKDMPEKDEESLNKEDVPQAFKKQLGEIANAYLEIKDALTNDDEKLGALTDKMEKALENTDMKLLTKNEQHMVWMSAQKTMLSDLEKFQSKKDIEEKRKVFAFLSNDLINTLQVMGLDMGSKSLYIEYCPMVDAFWLSLEKEIRNPYYGEKMIKCGEVKGTL